MYTKGEWYVEDRHTSLVVLCIPEGKDSPIVIADLDTSDCTLLEDEANAHLIAAAPKMYEALKSAINILRLEGYQDDQRVLKSYIKALSKADGGK
ncbi:hypothetical protein LCGC14_1451770 [marine sediment metagenome]|uniref:Uncharacterized protein n=1 Tax=marine sediment metagenome TaxID=412755 RepID=A0A0F9K403_9ZZZZ